MPKKKKAVSGGKRSHPKKAPMTGSVAAGFHEGSRSEVFADYLLSAWGTVTPVRRQDDHGHDLYCTLTDRIGQRAIVTDYYAVQVKSTREPLKFSGRKSVEWLVKNPNPLFLARVDKKKGVLLVYQTLARLFIAIQKLPASLTLSMGDVGIGECFSGLSKPNRLSLSAPILTISLRDSLDAKRMFTCRDALRDWIRIDRRNLDLRAAGLLRFQMPQQYRTDERPPSVWVEHGNLRPDKGQMARAVERLVETVDCVGHQLFAARDRKAALFAAALLRHLRAQHATKLPPRWQPAANTSLESEVRAHFNRGLRPDDSDWREATDVLEAVLRTDARTEEYLRQ